MVCVCVREGQDKSDKKAVWKGGGKSHPVVQAQWADNKTPPATPGPARARDPRRRPHQRGQLQPRTNWPDKAGSTAKAVAKAPPSAKAQPALVRHRTAEDLQGVASVLNQVTDLLGDETIR